MFAGGSAVCCIDEVSTGLDPISRRRIWEILLTEREKRTIIMTTHFLDEADYLADDVAIMYKGTLRASGTSASLKHSYGDGYTITLSHHTDIDIQLPDGAVQKELTRHQTVYRVATAALATQLVEALEKQNLHDYQISGPTMEDLFLTVTGDKIIPTNESPSKEAATETKDGLVTVDIAESDYELTGGRPISVFKQWWILLCKRCRILKRRFIPYFVAVAFAVVGAGVAPLLIKNFREPISCPTPGDLISEYDYRQDFGTSYYGSSRYYGYSDDSYQKIYVFGPASKLNDYRSKFDVMADVYSVNHTYSYSASYPKGYRNGSQIVEQLILVDTYIDFQQAVQKSWKTQGDRYAGEDYARIQGGIWMGDSTSQPAILGNVRSMTSMSQMANFFNTMLSGVPISAAYEQFAATTIPTLIDFVPLMFIIYYGLIMCW